MLLFTSTIAGLLLAYVSLNKVEQFLNKQIGIPATNKMIVLCLIIGSFVVYFGRFLRWNSWDIITNPLDLAKEIGVSFFFPVGYFRTWAITLLFTCLFSLLYFTLKKMTLPGFSIAKECSKEE